MTTILLTGKTGQVGWELQHTLAPLGRVIACDRAQMDLTDTNAIRSTIRDVAPDIIVNAAAYTAVDKAESEPALVMQVNAIAPGIMAEEAKRIGALLVHYSTDYVFDGTQTAPYTEDDLPNPLNIYGKSKLAGERAISVSDCMYLILRTSWIYSGRGMNFVLTILKLARERQELAVVDDQIGSPTWAPALARTTAELLRKAHRWDQETGIYHLAANGSTSRFDFAKKIIAIAQKVSDNKSGWATIRPTITKDYPLPAARPLNSATSKDRFKQTFGIEMTGWESQLLECLTEMYDREGARKGEG